MLIFLSPFVVADENRQEGHCSLELINVIGQMHSESHLSEAPSEGRKIHSFRVGLDAEEHLFRRTGCLLVMPRQTSTTVSLLPPQGCGRKRPQSCSPILVFGVHRIEGLDGLVDFYC